MRVRKKADNGEMVLLLKCEYYLPKQNAQGLRDCTVSFQTRESAGRSPLPLGLPDTQD